MKASPLPWTPPQQRLRTFEALTGLVGDIARTRPLLWTIEDVQWIDPTTLELIDLCLERVENLPVLILVSSRPGFQHAFGNRTNLTRLPLFLHHDRDGHAYTNDNLVVSKHPDTGVYDWGIYRSMFRTKNEKNFDMTCTSHRARLNAQAAQAKGENTAKQ